MRADLGRLEGIGSLACLFHHGNIVRSILQRTQRTPFSINIAVVAELAAMVLVRKWIVKMSNFLAADYDGLVELFGETVTDVLVEEHELRIPT